MKTTMLFRPIANPRRTTLAHLSDEDTPLPRPEPRQRPHAEPVAGEQPDPLPERTANPGRTILIDIDAPAG